MQKRRLKAPSPALVISLLALFVALGGTAYAATSLPRNSVGPKQLKNGAVRTKKIQNGAVGAGKIKNNAIRTNKIQDGAVTAAKINPAGLTVPSATHATSADSATNADNASKLGGLAPTDFLRSNAAAGGGLSGNYPNPTIAAGAITASKLGTITTVSNTTPIATGATGTVTVSCPSGSVVISGGAQPANFGVEMTSLFMVSNGWRYQAVNNSGGASSLTVFAYCLSG